jgi:hypothetical protein
VDQEGERALLASTTKSSPWYARGMTAREIQGYLEEKWSVSLPMFDNSVYPGIPPDRMVIEELYYVSRF